MTLKEVLKFMFLLTCVITTALVAIYSILYAIIYAITDIRFTWPVMFYFQYPATALISSLPLLVFIGSDDDSKRSHRIRLIIHFILTFVSTLVAMIKFFWSWDGWRNLFFESYELYLFLGLFSLIYAITFFVFYRKQKKLSDELNKKIQNLNTLR